MRARGRLVRIKVSYRQYDGREFLQIKKFLPDLNPQRVALGVVVGEAAEQQAAAPAGQTTQAQTTGAQTTSGAAKKNPFAKAPQPQLTGGADVDLANLPF